MVLRSLVAAVKNWSVREIAGATGLLVVSAGAGYYIYRYLQRESGPPDHPQPRQESVDVLRESPDPPSALQIIEPKVQLLPTEPLHSSSSVVLLTKPPPSAGELNQASTDVQHLSTVSCSSQSESVDIIQDVLGMVSGPESQLCCLETTESQLLNQEESSHVHDPEEHLSDIQVDEPSLQLPLDTSLSEPAADALPLGAGELDSTWHNIQFLSSEFPSSQSGSVDIRRYFLWMRRGPESRVCWFSTTETRYLNHLGLPYDTRIEDCFTGIQSVSGRVTEIVSCNRVEASVIVALDGYVQQTFKKVTCTYLHIATDGQLDTCTWEKKYIESPPGEAQSEPDSEESEETPEEVPFISCHLRGRGVTEIGVKLPALRQAFATLLASSHNQNFLFVAGKKIVMRLAANSKQEAVRVQLAYEDLLIFLRTPSNQRSIAAELSWENLHHYNFVDVFYELLVFRCFTCGLVPDTKFRGGFLERLMALIRTWEADTWKPASQIYFNELVVQLTDLCEVLFSQPLELFYYPAALAHVVHRLLMQHVQLMIDNLEKL